MLSEAKNPATSTNYRRSFLCERDKKHWSNYLTAKLVEVAGFFAFDQNDSKKSLLISFRHAFRFRRERFQERRP